MNYVQKYSLSSDRQYLLLMSDIKKVSASTRTIGFAGCKLGFNTFSLLVQIEVLLRLKALLLNVAPCGF